MKRPSWRRCTALPLQRSTHSGGAIAGGDTNEFLAERRDWTLSDENINMDARTYADGAGKLHVVLPIGSVAGADSYEQVLTLEGIGG